MFSRSLYGDFAGNHFGRNQITSLDVHITPHLYELISEVQDLGIMPSIPSSFWRTELVVRLGIASNLKGMKGAEG